MQACRILLIGLVGTFPNRMLEHVNKLAFIGMLFAIASVAVEAAHRQGDGTVTKGFAMLGNGFFLDAGKANPRNPARHAGEEFRNK